jgi:acetone carboxylase gamma subunit
MIPSSCKACGVHLPDDKIREIVTMYSLTFNSDREVVEEVYRRVFGAPMVPGKPVGFLCSSCGVQSLLDAVEDGYPPAQKFMKRLETSIRQDRLGLRLIKGEKR